MSLWATARASYREFFAVDRARIALACAAAGCSVALAVLLDRVAGGQHAVGIATAIVAVAVGVFALELAMDVG